jgi:multidrug efflux pump subunit AcrB
VLGSPLAGASSRLAHGRRPQRHLQIGLIMLIGLAAKNAILIVEFAKAKHEKDGMSLAGRGAGVGRLCFRRS